MSDKVKLAFEGLSMLLGAAELIQTALASDASPEELAKMDRKVKEANERWKQAIASLDTGGDDLIG